MHTIKNVVLVHGGFVDGSGWRGVYDLLKSDGFNVSVVQNPTISLSGDVAATHLAIGAQDGPVVLVGHSRSEEHTSELQSQSNLVCRLLLEHKKQRDKSGIPGERVWIPAIGESRLL